MTLDHHNTRLARLKPLMLAGTLALSLLVLTTLDSALTVKNTSLTVVALVLLGVLVPISIRLILQTRRLSPTGTPAVSLERVLVAKARLNLLALTLVAAALHLYDLGQENLWVDELWTVERKVQLLGWVLQRRQSLRLPDGPFQPATGPLGVCSRLATRGRNGLT